MNNHWKNKAWKYATVFVVVLLILNPEMVYLALFIDAIGLEMFFMLLKAQVIVALGLYYARLKSLYRCSILKVLWQKCREEPQELLLLAPSQATLMSMLVIFVMVDMAYKYVGLSI